MYERLTKRTVNNGVKYDRNEYVRTCYPHNEYAHDDFDRMAIRLAELEDKIEQGEIVIPKFAINQEVFYIGYKSIEYECPHCGEPCYKEEVDGVRKGIISERIITDNQGGIDIVYTIQIEEKNGIKLFTQRKEDIFLTREEAEKKLKELQEKEK